jgi:glycosyltransferase EpsH
MKNPLISVIVPVYNVEKYLTQCVDSVLSQTYSNIEVVLVDDGSTDASPGICDRYAQNDKRIIVIHKKNEGLSSARNKGLEAATGDYIMFVDSDDWIDLDTCEVVLEKALNTNVDLVFWSYVREFANQSLEKPLFADDHLFEEKECQLLYRRLFGLVGEELRMPEHADSFVIVCGKLYKKSVISGISFIDTSIIGTEDALFNIYVFDRIKRAAYLHKSYYHYRRNNIASLTKSHKVNLFHQWSCLYDYMGDVIRLRHLDASFQIALDNRIALSIIGLGLNECLSKKSLNDKIKSLKQILTSERYRKAYANLTLIHFPLHWKVFFFFAKRKYVYALYGMLYCINKIINRK